MNWRAVKAISAKDLKVVARSRAVFLPLILVPAILLVALPSLAVLAPGAANLPITPLSSMGAFMDNLPAGLQAELSGYDEAQRWVVVALVYFLSPLYLVVPLMVASVIAADSFAGEKERKTLEALLHTPATDRELLLGKVLSAWLPALGIALGGFVIYGVVANLVAWPVMGRVFFPNAMWIVLVIWVAPAVAGLGLGTMVLVSVRVRGFQEAYQLGGAVVLPIVALIVGQAAGVMYFSLELVLLLGLVIWVVDGVLLWAGGRLFQRERLLSRL